METIDVKTLSESDQRFIDTVGKELMELFIAMRSCPRSVTFFGAYVFKSGNPYFDQAEKLAKELSTLGYTIVTGGGFGIMEAGNKGAANVGKPSLGFNIRLPWRDPAHSWNPFVTHGVDFDYFFNRKIAMYFSSEAYVFFPGGVGTIDEFLEVLSMMRNQKTPKAPIILFGSDFWNEFDRFIKEHLIAKYKTVSESDLRLYRITDDPVEVLTIIKDDAAHRDENFVPPFGRE